MFATIVYSAIANVSFPMYVSPGLLGCLLIITLPMSKVQFTRNYKQIFEKFGFSFRSIEQMLLCVFAGIALEEGNLKIS